MHRSSRTSETGADASGEQGSQSRVTKMSIQQKRRSGNIERSSGVAFLNLPTAPQTRPLLHVNGRETTTSIIHSRLNSLSVEQQTDIARRLGHEDRNILWKVISRYNETDIEKWEKIVAVLDAYAPMSPQAQPPSPPVFRATTHNNAGQVPTLPPLEAYEYPDARYRYCDSLNHVMAGPYAFGLEPVDVTFNVPLVEPGHRIIMQCFLTQMSAPASCWPISAKIWINGLLVKNPGLERHLPPKAFFDVTDFLYGDSTPIRFQCDQEGYCFALVIRKTWYVGVDDLITELMTNPERAERGEAPYDIVLVDPVSHSLMRVPGKGSNCAHFALFDLKQYIEHQMLTHGTWQCPICHKSAQFHELLFSPSAMERINSAFQPQPELLPAVLDHEDMLDDLQEAIDQSWDPF